MSEAKLDRGSYDIASISKPGQEKRTNYVKDALSIDKQMKSQGQFVRVFADVFLKHEANKNRGVC